MEFSTSSYQNQPGDLTEKPVKVLIMGSGPAGLSAALYAARADLNPIVLTGMSHGGQVSLTFAVENYPGFPEGVTGTELVELFQKQAERFGTTVEFDTATKVDLSNRPFQNRDVQRNLSGRFVDNHHRRDPTPPGYPRRTRIYRQRGFLLRYVRRLVL